MFQLSRATHKSLPRKQSIKYSLRVRHAKTYWNLKEGLLVLELLTAIGKTIVTVVIVLSAANRFIIAFTTAGAERKVILWNLSNEKKEHRPISSVIEEVTLIAEEDLFRNFKKKSEKAEVTFATVARLLAALSTATSVFGALSA